MTDENNTDNTETQTETTTSNRPIARPVIRMLGKATGRGGGRRKVCRFCADTTTPIDYKNPQILKNFITDRGKITPRRISGNCAKHQRALSVAIRRARMIALLPFTVTGR